MRSPEGNGMRASFVIHANPLSFILGVGPLKYNSTNLHDSTSLYELQSWP